MKKIIFLILTLTLLSVFLVSCKKEEDKSTVIDDCYNYTKAFEGFESFEKYLNDPENQTENARIGKDDFVNFDSIIPNEEITAIGLWYNKYYEVRYYIDPQNSYDTIMLNVNYENNSSNNSANDNNILDTAIEETDISRKGTYIFDINGTHIGYSIGSDGSCYAIQFSIGKYDFSITGTNVFQNDNRTEAQAAFCEAFMTEAGTAEMLERIKALIPEEIE